MAFNSLFDNQMVSYAEAATGNFTLKAGQINPGGTQCMTKDMANTMYNLLATAGSDGILGYQLMQKSFWSASAYSHFLTMIVGNSGGAGGDWGYKSGTMGSITNPTTPIPLLGNGTIAELYYNVNGNFVGFVIQGVPSTTPPNNWTSIRIDGVGWGIAQFVMSFGSPYWYFNLSNANTNLFGTTVGATRTIEIIGTGAQPADTTAPSAPSSANATNVTASTLTLNWSASTDNVGVTNYLIYKNGVLYVTLTNVLTYNVTGLTASTAYAFTVYAKDATGNTSVVSNTVNVTTSAGVVSDTTAPSTPTNLSISGVTSTSMIIDWGASTDNVGIAGYKVYMNGSTTPLATIVTTQSTGTLSYTATGLSPSTSYYFTVKAYDSASTPNYSAGVDSAMIQTNAAAAGDTTPPTTPTNLVGTAQPCYVTLSWGASTDNSGGPVTYQIFRGGLFWDTSPSTYYEDPTGDLTTRTYTVKAVDASGNVSAASNSVSKRAFAC